MRKKSLEHKYIMINFYNFFNWKYYIYFFFFLTSLNCFPEDKGAEDRKLISIKKLELEQAVNDLKTKLTEFKKNIKEYKKLKKYKEVEKWLDEWDPESFTVQDGGYATQELYDQMIQKIKEFTKSINKILIKNKNN